MKYKIIKFSDLQKHNNLSAEFWINHKKKKCEICKK